MWFVTQPRTWLPVYVVLIGLIIYRYRSWKAVLLILLGFIIAVGLSDYLSSGILKPWVCRLRPTHEPAIDPVRLLNGYMGGLYGFCSSHASDTMAVAMLFSLLFRNKTATALLMLWVAMNCYSRMYLGVHYPTDILVGLLIGALWAWLVFVALRAVGVVARQGGS